MRLVTAVLPTAGFEQVREALRTLGIPGVTVSTVYAQGVLPPRYEVYRGVRWRVDLLPAVRMDIVAADADADDIVRVIAVAGGGSVWVQRVEEVVRIRTGERGGAAL
ncbi:P-II family nitrogen regulator [Streptacidiphilus albus]|uniref:P-II family nitrogen regulator n=1 Tax=Streptacidiphilus albus TaxID=105425 RepID=UPI00054C0452|nr:P-II family nitrogen regulator [Streptacidiphilus albus]